MSATATRPRWPRSTWPRRVSTDVLADLPPIAGPHIEYALIAPILIITAAAVIGTVVEALVPRGRRFEVQALVAVVGVVAALVDTVVVYNRSTPSRARRPHAARSPPRERSPSTGRESSPGASCWSSRC